MLAPIALLALAAAQLPENPCANVRIPEPWTSWTQSGDAIAGGDANSAPRLILGKPVLASLRPISQVQFPAKPARTEPKSYGGLFTVTLKTPARVGIGLSGPAWVDTVSGQIPNASVEHGHGPECSGIRKIVWFDLAPGTHWVQIANSASREIRVMAADAIANQPLPPVSNSEF